MTTSSDILQQLLPKPPRLLPDGSGYDWREFNRWMQNIYNLLGPPQNDSAVNITTVPTNGIEHVEDDFLTDQSFEIQMLRKLVEQLSNEVYMIPNYQQEILNLKNQVNDTMVEIGVA